MLLPPPGRAGTWDVHAGPGLLPPGSDTRRGWGWGRGWGGGGRAGAGPAFLKENAPRKPQLCARVQPLLANTSLSNHLIFTSSVYTLADGFQVNESPAAAVDGCHGALSAHRKRGRLFTVLNTGEGNTAVHLPARPGPTHAFKSFLPCHLSPRKRLQPCLNLREPCPAAGPQRRAICMPSAVIRLGLCNKEDRVQAVGL